MPILCADLPAATPFLLAEAQQAGQSSIRAPPAKEPAAALAGAATCKAPKRAKRAKAPEAAATSLVPKSFGAPSEAASSQQETASGCAEKPTEAVQATPAVACAASAAAKADALPLTNGGSAASTGAMSAGVARSKAQPSAAATIMHIGTTVQPTAAAYSGAPAGQPRAAPAAHPPQSTAQAASKAAQTPVADQPVSQQGVPGPAPAGAASLQLEQPAGAAGKQIASAVGPVPHGPSEAKRPAGAGLHSVSLPAATAPAEANVSKAAQEVQASKLAPASQEVGRNTPASSPGKLHQPTVPAKTGVVSAPADSIHQQVQDVTRLGPDCDPESSPTLITDVKVRRIC